MLKLENFYKGEHFSVYYTWSPPELYLVREKEKEQLREWKPGDKPYPNCIDQNGTLYIADDEPELEDVEFVESVSNEEWEIIPKRVPPQMCFRVEEIPLIFCLSWRSFVVERSKIYQLPIADSVVNFRYKERSFLEGLDRWGLVPKRLEITLPDHCTGYVEGGIPVGLVRENVAHSVWWMDIAPIKDKLYPDVPLRKNLYEPGKCWIADKDGLIWTSPYRISLTQEEVKQAFNIVTNQPFEVQPLLDKKRGVSLLPLEEIESVESQRLITICPGFDGWYNMKWRDEKNNILVEKVTLKKPYFFEAHSALISGLTDLPQILEQHKIVKLSKKLLAGSEWFQLYYIEAGELKSVAGRYAYVKDTYPSKSSLNEEREKRANLLSTLQYVLPGDPLEWTEDQFLTYDRLRRNGEYNVNQTIRIADGFNYRLVSDELLELYTKAGGVGIQFLSSPVSKRDARREVRLYKVVELSSILAEAEKSKVILAECGFIQFMHTLGKRGFPHEYQQEILEKVFNSEVNKAVEDSSARQVEKMLITLGSLGVSKEVIVEALATYLHLPESIRVVLHNQYSVNSGGAQ